MKASLPTGLDAEHQKKLDELKAKSGKEFDRAYGQMQLQAHEEAVALFSDYARNGDNPDLKAWAAKTLPHLREHLEWQRSFRKSMPFHAGAPVKGTFRVEAASQDQNEPRGEKPGLLTVASSFLALSAAQGMKNSRRPSAQSATVNQYSKRRAAGI